MVQPTALNDVLFKKVFATPENSHILIGFLQDILGIIVESVEILSPYQIETYYENMEQGELLYTEVDVLAKVPDESYISIELQVTAQDHFNRRIHYYLSERYAALYEKKDKTKKQSQMNKYDSLRPIHSLNIVNHQIFDDTDAIGTFKYVDSQHKNRLFLDEKDHEISAITFFELVKKETASPNVRAWIDFFLTGKVAANGPSYIKDACKIIQYTNLTKGERKMVDLAQKARDIQQSIIIERENKAEKKGIEQGRILEKMETAKNLKKIGVAVQDIMSATGLSRDQVESL